MSGREPEVTPARIAALETLPLFHQVRGRRALVAGGSQAALWKAELLSAAGAEVLVLAGHESAARLFEALVAQPVDGPVTVLARSWTPEDFSAKALAVGDISDTAEVERFVSAAHAAGAVVNLIDRPQSSDVQFGTIVNRSPIVLGISTGGGAPMLGQSIRARIEALLPRGLSLWAAAARSWRPRLRHHLPSFAERRSFWARFVDHAWRNVGRGPDEADFTALTVATPNPPNGSVTLVGAGPGDPDFLTMKAVRALQSATYILYDDLVVPEILELGRREAIRISVGKRGHGSAVNQAEINRRLVSLALAGETVIRLKGGDPTIFGRASEEILACRAAGVEVSVIPGLSAAQGAAAALGISLTEREIARRVQFVTGHGADGGLPDDLDWHAIADPVTTTIIYMPRNTLAAFVCAAREQGLDPATPAVAIASATRPDQIHVAGAVRDIAALAETLPAGAPVAVIIGRVVRNVTSEAGRLTEAA